MNVDSLLLDLFYLATFTWMAIFALWALLRLASGVHSTILVVMIVHFVLAGVPLLLDVVVGRPQYVRFPGFRTATSDLVTNLIYCFYILLTSFLWWWMGGAPVRPTLHDSEQVKLVLPRVLRLMLFMLLLSPLVAVALAPNPGVYASYGAVIRNDSLQENQFHNLVALLSVLSLISGALILALSNKSVLRDAPVLFIGFVAATWLHGKRSVIAIGLFLWAFVLWYRGYLRRGRLFVAGFICILVLAGFSLAYQTSLRNIETNQLYENVRIDYGRDDVIKMTIFAELHPDTMKILEFRGQSILFHLTTYVPRQWWPGKPLPYGQYFTSALLMQPPQLWGWGMTTTWLSEAIANFSWLGIIIGPLTIALICRIGDARKNIIVFTLTSLVASLLLAVHLTAFAPVFLFWVLTVIWFGRRSRRITRKAFALR